MKPTKRLFFAIKKIRAAGAQSIDQGIVIPLPRLINDVGTTCRGEESDEIKLLRRERLFTDDENATCNEGTRLLGHTTDKCADLVTLFRWNDIEHRLPGGVGDA